MGLLNLAAIALAVAGSAVAAPAWDGTLEPRHFPTCFPAGSPEVCELADIKSCYNTLKAKGSKSCLIFNQSTNFCTKNGCKVYGQNDSGQPSVDATCGQVADAVQQIIQQCNRFSPTCLAGSKSLDSNDYYVVNVDKS